LHSIDSNKGFFLCVRNSFRHPLLLMSVDNRRRFLHVENEVSRTLADRTNAGFSRSYVLLYNATFRRVLHVFRDILFLCSSRFYFDLVELELLILFTALLAVVQFQSQSPASHLNLWTARRTEFLDLYLR